jgi:predicted RNase H-like nuclease
MGNNSTNIIGIDCATEDKNTGLALGILADKRLTIKRVSCGKNKSAVDQIIDWLSEGKPALIALDAPLGWPIALAQKLNRHTAGNPITLITEEIDQMFSRDTDRMVREKIGKKPLEVGAAPIARTAFHALKLLQVLRDKTKLDIPLAWEMGRISETCAIEVYPAATLTARGVNDSRYKGKGKRDRRLEVINQICNYLELAVPQNQLLSNADITDAVICVLAGADFLMGNCIPLTDFPTACKEGWIWVKDPKSKAS